MYKTQWFTNVIMIFYCSVNSQRAYYKFQNWNITPRTRRVHKFKEVYDHYCFMVHRNETTRIVKKWKRKWVRCYNFKLLKLHLMNSMTNEDILHLHQNSFQIKLIWNDISFRCIWRKAVDKLIGQVEIHVHHLNSN